MRDAIDSVIAAIAGPQHGVVTRNQLLALGLTDDMIEYRIRIGRLHRLHNGVYAVGYLPVSPHARAHAAVLACGPGAALSHHPVGSHQDLEGAARGHGAVGAPPRPHLHPPLAHAHATGRHRALRCPRHHPGPHAPRQHPEPHRRAADPRRQRPPTRRLPEAERRHRAAPPPSPHRLREHTAHPERPPTRSEFEDAFLPFVKRYALPEPQINTMVAGHEADVFFPDHRLVVELDSWEFHSDRAQFERDRDRDPDLLAAGVATVRLTWDRFLGRPAREAARLHRILTARTSSR